MNSNEHYEQEGFAMTCRSYVEYVRMFDCDPEAAPSAVLLDVAGGASSFGAGARQRGLRAVSADPLYRLTPEEMEAYGYRELEEAAGKLAKLTNMFDWSYYGSVEAHTKKRKQSLDTFLEDYRVSFGTEAYVTGSLPALPALPFSDDRFSHVFCSHLLFLYAEQLPYEFHLEALLEMARVCRPGGEIRVYPLVDLKQRPYDRLDQLVAELRGRGLAPELLDSKLPFIPGSGQLLCIRKPE